MVDRKLLVLGGLAALAVAGVLLFARPTSTEREIVVFLPSAENPFWVDVRSGAVDGDVPGDGIKIKTIASGDMDGANQVDQMKSVLDRGTVAAIVVGLADNSAPAPIIAQYNERNIPVVLIDTTLEARAAERSGAHWDVFIGSDNREGGRMAAETMLSAIPPGDNKQSVLLIKGSYVHQSAIDRAEGFIEGIDGKLTILERDGEWQRERASEITSGVLSREAISGIFASNDDMALGAVAAIRNSGLTGSDRPIVIGYDATDAGVAAVNSGDMYATIKQQSFELGRTGVLEAVKLADGIAPAQANISVPLAIVKAE